MLRVFSTEGLAWMLIRVPIIVLALTVHEWAHAWSAWRLGDPTAKAVGRVSFNPLRHLELLGTICLLFAPIGWAKPVPVNPFNFRHPRRDDVLVSVAGPMSNLFQAIVFALLLRLPWQEWVFNAGPGIPDNAIEAARRTYLWPVIWLLQTGGLQQLLLAGWIVLSLGMLLNVGLAVFNMLPFFPLDGHHVARENLSGNARDAFIRFQPLGPFVILGLVLLDNHLRQRGLPGPISLPIGWLRDLLLTYLAGSPGRSIL